MVLEPLLEFALAYGAEWRPNFEDVFLDVVGVDAETLYYDWLAYISEQYERQYDRVRAKGEVVGKEFLDYNPGWEYKVQVLGILLWETKKVLKIGVGLGAKPKEIESKKKESTGNTWNMEPRVSPDGNYIGHLSRGAIKVWRYEKKKYVLLQVVLRSFERTKPTNIWIPLLCPMLHLIMDGTLFLMEKNRSKHL